MPKASGATPIGQRRAVTRPSKAEVKHWVRALWPWLLSALFFLFYLSTLAPTVLWGDDAGFQRAAFTGELPADGSGHWLWLQAARLFARLPWGDIAFRVNLLSAVAAAATLLVLYLAARALELSEMGATVAVVSLAVGHTFWMHAVRAEVYTVFTLFLALLLLLVARWRRGDNRAIYVAAALFGTTLLAHQMALLLLPAAAFLLWQRRRWLTRRAWLLLMLAALLGLLPFFAVVSSQIAARADVSLPVALRLYFTHAGVDFAPAFFDFAPHTLLVDVGMWIGFLGLQFVGLAFLLGIWGIVDRLSGAHPALWNALFLLYLTDVFFAISYRVNDRYVFFLPGYLVFALFAGAGWEAAWRALRRRFSPGPLFAAVGLALLVLAPLVSYYSVPRLLVAAGANPLGIRTLPGREPNTFFLWPGKAEYRGAADYGWQTLAALADEAVLIADHTPLETLRYLQVVEGLREDVTLVKIEPGQDLAPLVAAQEANRPIYLAADDPAYYNLRNLRGLQLLPEGPVFRLQR